MSVHSYLFVVVLVVMIIILWSEKIFKFIHSKSAGEFIVGCHYSIKYIVSSSQMDSGEHPLNEVSYIPCSSSSAFSLTHCKLGEVGKCHCHFLLRPCTGSQPLILHLLHNFGWAYGQSMLLLPSFSDYANELTDLTTPA